MSGANKCQKQFICDCYPNGKVQDCAYKVSSCADWVCDCQAAVGEHIALCNCDAANRAADIKEQSVPCSNCGDGKFLRTGETCLLCSRVYK